MSQGLSTLTERELEVLALIGQGLSNPQIADTLCISVGTVRTHIKRIYDKTGLGGRSQAMRYAIAHGLVSAPPEEWHVVAAEGSLAWAKVLLLAVFSPSQAVKAFCRNSRLRHYARRRLQDNQRW